MLLNITINKTENLAGIVIITDEGLEVEWKDLQSTDQVLVINSLVNFVDLFYKDYARLHPEVESPVEEAKTNEVVE